MDQREEIKSKIDLVELINSYVPLKKAGVNFRACCPFHSEKTPSFMVSPERQIWKCFGCGEGGDAFSFYMKMENVEFGPAIRELAKRAGVTLKSYVPTQKEKDQDLLFEINHYAAEYYHYILLNLPIGKKALDYIMGRGINKESLKEFQIGYSPASWDSLIRFLVVKKKYRIEDLQRAGLVTARSSGGSISSFYDRFRGRLMFPLKDHRGNVCGFSGRVLDPKAKEAKYINTQETEIYHKSDILFGLSQTKEEIKKQDAVILVEGQLDLVSSFQVGVKNVAAVGGTALTLSQIKLLKRFTNKIVFALDSDFAGDKAAHRGIELADGEGFDIKVIELAGGKDPDELAQKNPEAWQKLTQNPIGVYDYFINSAFARFDGSTSEGKRKIGSELAPVLAKIANQIVFSHYVNLLARRLDVDPQAIMAEIIKLKEQNVLDKTIPNVVEQEKPRREILEEYLLALAFQIKKPEWLNKKKVFSVVKTNRFTRILEALAVFKYKGEFKSNDFAASLSAETLPAYNHLYLIAFGDLSQDESLAQKEFNNTYEQIVKLSRQERLKSLRQDIDRLEATKNLTKAQSEKLEKYLQKFAEISAKLKQD